MAFGSILNEQMTARERARQSLEEIAARGQNRAQEIEMQNAFNRSAVKDERAYREQRDREEWKRGAEERDLRRGLLQSQMRASDALAEQRSRSPEPGAFDFSMPSVNQHTPESYQRFIEGMMQNGQPDYSVLEPRSQVDAQARAQNQLRESALDDAIRATSGDRLQVEDNLERYGIDPSTPVQEAQQKLFDIFYNQRLRAMGAQSQPATTEGLLSAPNPAIQSDIQSAKAALQRGATIEDIQRRMQERGVDPETMQAILDSL
jgi:hypothetical protein